MNFIEAWKRGCQGEKIRCVRWMPGCYWDIRNKKIFFVMETGEEFEEEMCQFVSTLSEDVDGYWEVYEA